MKSLAWLSSCSAGGGPWEGRVCSFRGNTREPRQRLGVQGPSCVGGGEPRSGPDQGLGWVWGWGLEAGSGAQGALRAGAPGSDFSKQPEGWAGLGQLESLSSSSSSQTGA